MSKYTQNCTKLHHFLKFSWGSMPPNPLTNAQRVHLTSEIYDNTSHFLKIIPSLPMFEHGFMPLHITAHTINKDMQNKYMLI